MRGAPGRPRRPFGRGADRGPLLTAPPAWAILPPAVADQLAEHARREAPRECCGVLIGRQDAAAFHVVRAVAGRNLIAAHDLYELDPEDFVRADSEADGEGLAVIGFYHSHPRGPERLSKIDRDRAWPGYLQVLVVPQSGSGCRFSAWVSPSEQAEFLPVTLR